VVRRHGGHAASQIHSGEIILDLASHEASYRGKTAVLQQREFALLKTP
jgi:DNA-binding response OmpR family regulator